MELDHRSLRARLVDAVVGVLEPLPAIRAGWEGGSAAFEAVDEYSDIDLCFIVDSETSYETLYAIARQALETVSPVSLTHDQPPGRYYKLSEGGEFLFVDLCFFRTNSGDHPLEAERHGAIKALFDKDEWLKGRRLDETALAAKREARLRELQGWFAASQSFVRKAILRGHEVEALAAFWGYTLKPLAELLRMRYCPARWDFGTRYLHRDLPEVAYREFEDLAFVTALEELEAKLATAEAWGTRLLHELGPGTSDATA